MNRDPILDSFAVHAPALDPAAFLLPSGKVLRQLSILLVRRVDPGIQRFCTHPHTVIVGMLDGEAPADLFRGPPPPQMPNHPINERVICHPVRLMRPCATRIGMELCLACEIHAVAGAAGVEFVPQVRAEGRVVAFGLPRAFLDLAADSGAVHTNPSGDFRLGVAAVQELLDLDSVVEEQVAVMCGQGSAALRWWSRQLTP